MACVFWRFCGRLLVPGNVFWVMRMAGIITGLDDLSNMLMVTFHHSNGPTSRAFLSIQVFTKLTQ